jgi:hypothetical protein
MKLNLSNNLFMKTTTINTTAKLVASAMFIAAIFLGNKVNAQSMASQNVASNPWRFGIGLETGMPTGSLEKNTRWDLGGTARLQYNVAEGLGIMLTSGYYNFFAGSNTNTTTKFGSSYYGTVNHDLGIIPVKLGLKGYLGSNGLYVSAEGGVGFETKYNEDKKLILSPGLGWSDKTIDISARYENFSGQDNNYGLIGLRIAYGFTL